MVVVGGSGRKQRLSVVDLSQQRPVAPAGRLISFTPPSEFGFKSKVCSRHAAGCYQKSTTSADSINRIDSRSSAMYRTLSVDVLSRRSLAHSSDLLIAEHRAARPAYNDAVANQVPMTLTVIFFPCLWHRELTEEANDRSRIRRGTRGKHSLSKACAKCTFID